MTSIERKSTSSLVLQQLYEFFFRRQKMEFATYAIALLAALAYAVINDFVLHRPGPPVFYEGCIVGVVVFLSVVASYVYATTRGAERAYNTDNVRRGSGADGGQTVKAASIVVDAKGESRVRTLAPRGVAGVAAGMGTLLLALLSNLPDDLAWKKWWLCAAPLLSYGAATAVQHILFALGSSITSRRLTRKSRQLKRLLHAYLEDASTSDAHKANLQTRLEELQLLEAESKLARIRGVLEAESRPTQIREEMLEAEPRLARMREVLTRIRELASITAPKTEDSLHGTLDGVGSSDQAVGRP